jgi:hypothetical protein
MRDRHHPDINLGVYTHIPISSQKSQNNWFWYIIAALKKKESKNLRFFSSSFIMEAVDSLRFLRCDQNGATVLGWFRNVLKNWNRASRLFKNSKSCPTLVTTEVLKLLRQQTCPV